MTSITVLNGPNLNTLGTRKPEVYGRTTLADVEEMCREEAGKLGLELEFRQSNYEGQLIDWIHELGPAFKSGESIGVVYNPGAHTHYSYAIRDAIEAAQVPVIELHISNVHAREEFRHHSVISPVARGIIVGFGVPGYSLAIRGLYELHEAEVTKHLKPGVAREPIDMHRRIAVAGAGLIGQRHIEEIDASPSAELAAIVDPFPAAAEVAAKYSVPLYPSLAELFAADKPDGVILATPNPLHVAGGLECVAAGVPVIVEKPIGDTVEARHPAGRGGRGGRGRRC